MRSWAAMLALTSCTPGDGALLVDALAWEEVADVDPLPEHRESDIACDATGWGEEIGGLEVQTDLCPYGVFTQPLLHEVREGRTVHVLAWHSDLVSETPAEGHLHVRIDGEVVADWVQPIPSRAAVLDVEWEAPVRLAEGVPVVVHVHNHGTNAWNLNAISR